MGVLLRAEARLSGGSHSSPTGPKARHCVGDVPLVRPGHGLGVPLVPCLSALWEADGGLAIRYELSDAPLLVTFTREEAKQLLADRGGA